MSRSGSGRGEPPALGAPRAVLLDFGGTLFRQHGYDPLAGTARLLELAARNPRGADAEMVRLAAHDVRTELRDTLPSTLEFPSRQLRRLVFERLGVIFSHSPDTLDLEYWQASVKSSPEPGVVDSIKAMARRRLKLGVVSNCPFSAPALHHALRSHGLVKAMSCVLSSADYGVRKPHPALFRAALGRLDVRPEETWFIGDSLANDVAGSRAIGMTAIWYNPTRAELAGPEPDAEIRHWSELEELLEAAAPGDAAPPEAASG